MGGMATFGLGIVLTVTDNATGKLTGVNSSLQQVSQTAMSLNYMGKSLWNTGKSMISPIVGLSKELIRVNDDVEKTRITFGALYGDAGVAEQKLNDIIDYAAKTPFDIEGLKEAALQFKTLGIEIIGEGSAVTDSVGNTRQLIDILGDAGAGLSGIARNGFKDVTYAAREFITEGNKLSMLRRLGVDVDAVLEKGYQAKNTMEWISASVGDTAEERLKNFADLVNALKMDNLMGELSGSWSTMISNVDDVWFKFLKRAGDNGAFNVFKDSLKSILDIGDRITNDSPETEAFFKNIGSAFKMLNAPLDKAIALLGKFVDTLIGLGGKYPIIAKLAMAIPLITGGLFMLSGAGLIAKSSLMLFKFGLLQVAGTIPMFAKWAILFAGLKYAWSNDIGGIRTNLTNFANAVSGAFATAKDAMSKDTPEMISIYKGLVDNFNKTGDLQSGLAAKIMAFKVLWGGLLEFMSSPENKVSVETLDIIDQMGLMSTFEKMSIWAYRAKEFGKGVAEGLSEAVNAVTNFARKISEAFAKLPLGKGSGLFDMFSGAFNVSGGDKFKSFGKFVTQALLWSMVLKKVWGVFSLFSGRRNRGSSIGDILGRIFGTNRDNGGGGDNTEGILTRLRRLGSTLANIRPRQILQGLLNLGIIMGGISAIALVVGGIASINPRAFVLGGIAMAAMSLMVAPISNPAFDTALNSISRMSHFKPKTFLKGIGNLGVILGAMTAIAMILGAIVSISPAAFVAGGVAMVAMGACFSFLGNPLFINALTELRAMAKIKPTTILKGIGNLAIILGAMAVLFMILGAVSMIPFDYGRIVQLALVLGVLGIVGAALAKLGDIVGHFSFSHTVGGFIAMGAALLAMSALFVILGAVSLIPFDYGRVAKLVLMIGLLGAVGLALVALSAGAGGIAMLGGGMGAAAIIAGVIAIAGVLVVMSGLMLLINAITSSLNVDRIDTVMTAILKVGAIGTALVVLSGISGAFLAPAIAGIIAIGIVVAALAGLSLLFAKFESHADKIQSGLNVMATIGKGIGKAIGSFVAGVGEAVSASLPAIGENIRSFMDSISSISAPTEGEVGVGDFLSSLATGLLKLTANDLLSFFTGGTDFAGIAEGLNQLAGATSFFDFCNQYGAEAFDNAKKFFECLADIGNIPNSGGFLQDIVGTNDFAGTATGLNQLAQTQPFFDFCGKLQPVAFDNAKKFFQSLSDISNIPNVGGIAQVFSGTNDFSGTATGLNTLATASTFFDWVGTLDVGVFDKTKQLFEALSGIGEAFPNTGGVAQWFTGENDISGVGSKLKKFGTDTKDFFKMVGDLKVGNLSSLWSSIKKAGEVADTDLSGLADLGTQLTDFLTNSKGFFDGVGDINIESMNSFAEGLSNFFTTVQSIVVPSMESMNSSVSTMNTTLASIYMIAMQVGQSMILVAQYAQIAGVIIVQSFNTMATGMSIIAVSAIANATVVVQAFMLMAMGSAQYSALIIQNFLLMAQGVQTSAVLVQAGMLMMYSAVLAGSALIISAISSMCAMVQSQLSSLASSGYGYGSALASSIAAGISANSGAIAAAVQSAISSAVSRATINIPKVNIGHNAKGTSNWAGGLTEINERGGELVDLPQGTRIYPHDKSVTMAFDDGVQTAFDTIARNSNRGGDNYDDSVHFNAGSIVIYAQNTSNEEAERFAEMIMQKIERKQRRKALATYAY